jgi:hypothetical protein
MNMKQVVKWQLTRETEVLGGNLPPPLPHIRLNLGHHGGKLATNHLSYGTVKCIITATMWNPYLAFRLIAMNGPVQLDMGNLVCRYIMKTGKNVKAVLVLNYLSPMPWWHMGEWRYSSTILDLSTRWWWVVSFMSMSLYHQGNIPRYPLDRRLSGPQSWSGCCGVEKHLLPLSGIEPGPSSL